MRYTPASTMADSFTVAVLSGKGGTGKTLVSVNLAAAAGQATYIDCDVEEPNGHLFLKPTLIDEEVITTGKPVVDAALCDGCKICSDACAFKALAVVNKRLLIFEEICHSCGLCYHLCPQGALTEVQHKLGVLTRGRVGELSVLSASLKIGEPSGVPLISALLQEKRRRITIIDSPPGSGCLVTETVGSADFCLLVAEPTIFGAQNLGMVHRLVTLMGKPTAVLLNKVTDGHNPSEAYAKEHGLKIIGSIPYDEELALLGSDALVAVWEEKRWRTFFSHLLETVLKEGSDAHALNPQR
jgi:MinD superfamily P-loop ATPase